MFRLNRRADPADLCKSAGGAIMVALDPAPKESNALLRIGRPPDRALGQAGRAVGHRLVSLAALVVLAGALTPVVGIGVAEAATHTVASVTPASSTNTVGMIQQLTATVTPAATLLEPAVVVTFKVVSGPNAGVSLPSCT